MLELKGLTRRYGSTVALDGLSLQVPEGEVVGFVGPNGAGKTTAMRIALGVLEADAGEVVWRGEAATRAVQSGFGYMPEERGLYPKMRVDRQLRYLATLHGRRRGRGRARRRALDRATRARRARRAARGGALARQPAARAARRRADPRPRCSILDEPFSGLDPIGTDVMAEVLRERAGEGAAVIFSSHQLELVERLCDSVAIVAGGRIVAAGRVGELRAERSEPRLRVDVEGAGEGWLDGLEGVHLVSRDERGVLVELRDGADDQAVLDAARRAGRVRRFEPARPTLAELFREVVEA